ncbi:MAG: hypothetical protein ACRETN_08230 [Nevskiales bacterium]
MTDPGLTIPRRLVQQVFHHAQTAPGGAASGLIGASAEGGLKPYPLLAGENRQSVLEKLRARRERLFAIYYVHPRGPGEPLPEEQAPDAESYIFIIALDTRGVLQLRAWRGARELPAKIIED